MHLWDKGGKTSKSLISFTSDSDRALDGRLAPYDIAGSAAHAVMLASVSVISEGDMKALLSGLAVLMKETEEGRLDISEGFEDIHSYVEYRLHDLSGEAAGRLHTGRSRNDQVLTDLFLWLRDVLSRMAGEVNSLAGLMLGRSALLENALMPGFTHLQPAMVSSFGLWFAAYAESLCDDLRLLADAQAFTDASPLGTAAGYGTTLPVDREMTAGLLRFRRLVVTSPYAQMSRGRTERIVTSAIASLADTFGNFASDVVLFMSPGFGFLSLSDDLTTGSSIMPHKKNPDLFELIRARAARLKSLPGEVTLMTTSLPPGYNRDFQELKAILFEAVDGITELIDIMSLAVSGLVIKEGLFDEGRYNDIFSVEEANQMALKGIPFREAYRIIAAKAGSGEFRQTSPSDYTHTGSIGNTGSAVLRNRLEEVMKAFRDDITPMELFNSVLKDSEGFRKRD